jgi:hypothetical protein
LKVKVNSWVSFGNYSGIVQSLSKTHAVVKVNGVKRPQKVPLSKVRLFEE